MHIFMKPYVQILSPDNRDFETEFNNLFKDNSCFEDHSFMLSMLESSQNIDILQEGFSDILESARSFFEKLIKVIKEFVKRQITLMKSYIADFNKFLEKHKDYLYTLNPDFNMEVYSFTIDEASPNLSYIKDLVYSYRDGLSRITTITSDEIKEMKKKFEDNKNQMRGNILGTNDVITSDDFYTVVKNRYRDNSSKPYKTRITKGNLTFAIETFPKLKQMKDSVEKEEKEIVALLNELKKFFSKSPTTYYRDNRRYIALKDIEMDNNTLKYTRAQDIEYDMNHMKKIDSYFSFKFAEAKFISDVTTTVFREKINAIRDAMKQYKDIIIGSIKEKNDASKPQEQ